MKISVYSKSWVVVQAETISEGVQLGILHEELKAIGRNVPVLGGDIMEIPLKEPDEPVKLKKKQS